MIRFHSDSDFIWKEKARRKAWLLHCIKEACFVPGELNFIASTKEGMLEMNKKYLFHDYHTDIITFDYSNNKKLSGDLFLGVETIMDQAMNGFDEELDRVMVHGVLHLMGHNDKTKEQRKQMAFLEDLCLSLRP